MSTRVIDGIERVVGCSFANLDDAVSIGLSGDYFGMLTCLESLSLDHNKMLDGTIMEIWAPTLTALNLSSSPKVMGSVRDMKSFPNLVKLRLDHMPMVTGNLEHMRLSLLQELNLSHTNVTGSVLHLAVCRQSLRRVSLAACAGVVGNLDEDLDLPAVEELDLAFTGVGGGFISLEKSMKLRKLNLSNTAVEGKLHELSGLSSLTHLYLDGTATSGLIKSLPRSLRSADMDFTRVEATRDEMAEFRKAHPGAVLLVRQAFPSPLTDRSSRSNRSSRSHRSSKSAKSNRTVKSTLSKGRYPH